MKQQKTTVLIALLTVVAYTLGHASVTVKDGWEEPIVVWLAVILKTGNVFVVLMAKFKVLAQYFPITEKRTNLSICTGCIDISDHVLLFPTCTVNLHVIIVIKL